MATEVTINPGVCGFITEVVASSENDMDVKISLTSGCEPVERMLKELGDTYNSYDVCLAKPGKGPIYDYAAQNYPGHCACPVPAGIIKAIEAECHLALPRDSYINFK